MTDTQNAVNDAQGANVDAQTCAQGQSEQPSGQDAQESAVAKREPFAQKTPAGDGQNAAAGKAGGEAKSAQTREQNAWFAEQRRTAEAARAEAQAAWEEQALLMAALEARGYTGTAQDIAHALAENPDERPSETPGGTDDGGGRVFAHPAYLHAKNEAVFLRGEMGKAIFSRDAGEINKAFPDAKLSDVRELGPDYGRLRAAGVSNLAAYSAVRAARAAGKTPPPPQMGSLDAPAGREKDFYSPEEVDRLTKKELGDPRIWALVRKSMTRWR